MSNIVLLTFLMSFIPLAYAQNDTIAVVSENKMVQGIDSTNFKKYIRSLPAFTMFGDNYFITGTTTGSDAFTSDGSDAKFEIGFKQRLTNLELPWETFPFITYRQKAFWDIYKESFPFRETNYNPALGLAKLFFNEEGLDYGLYFAFEHESNGRDGENNRSWNFFSLSYAKPMGEKLHIRAKAWLPVGDMEDNEDITSYRGYFNFGATYRVGSDVYFDLDVQPAYDEKIQGHVKACISFKISKSSNQFVYVQYFGGYSEDLVDYSQSVSNLRIGIVFKDLFLHF
ncbi:Phospholipase A(1) [Flagellimonas maritima]|uniref:Phosphatidylcholine 1-acylhydrolase n=2 Tax=Flagellimonas maritima TaxID=1383885 RepID=A0A2Z4LRQ3_9FLAO|nr:Phospholipase A(1) [Allomuricauda aurantiaca]